jgi:hypothetical protein
MRVASLISLGLEPQEEVLDRAIAEAESTCHPIWPALARHISRLSNQHDRDLLERFSAHPELCELPLSWGLKYIVRGDLMLDDGAVITLDQLAGKASLPALPLLESMPEELSIPKAASQFSKGHARQHPPRRSRRK